MSNSTIRALLAPALAALLLAAPLACDDDPAERPTDGSIVGEGTDQGSGSLKLTGKITDSKGVAVESAKIELGGKQGFSGSDGSYTIDEPPVGAGKVTVTQAWFKEKKDVDVTVAAAGATTLDITIEAWPLKLEAADKTLADNHNQTFDWTKDKLAIAVLDSPTRKNLDTAIYYMNPALYRDTSSTTSVDSKLTLTNLAGKFAIGDGANKGTDALVPGTVKDAIGQTPVTAAAQQDFMLFRPLFNWLTNWDSTTTKIKDLSEVKKAVQEQDWGSNAVRPQRLEQVFLYNDELWAQIVFEPFVQVGAGITDKDGDGYKEIYGKIDPKLYSAELLTALKDDYIKTTYDTNGISKQVNDALNELYSVTAADVETYIGRPYTLPNNKGTISYPLVVLKHSATGTPVYQVLLAGP